MNIHEMRASLGDTQSEFAERYNIPFRTIQNWEAGVRRPPLYIMHLLESRVRSDLANRKTVKLPTYDPRKADLPARSDFVGAMSWLKAVHNHVGGQIVFALDEALMCQGNFLGRNDEYILDMQGITEALSNYYFEHGDSFDGLVVPPGLSDKFESLANDAIDYYSN